jgi:hypothetical protein
MAVSSIERKENPVLLHWRLIEEFQRDETGVTNR